MELRSACRKMMYLKKIMTSWGDRQQQTPRFNYLQVAIKLQLIYHNGSANLERLRQFSLYWNTETQDRVQGKLRSTLEPIQAYLVRVGRRRYNLGPRLFRQVLEPNIRDSKEKKKLEKNIGHSNLEQQAATRVFHVEENIKHSENNNAQRLGYNNRPALSLPPHQSSRRDATISMLQLQWSLLQLQRNAVWSFNGPENLYQMLPTSSSRGQEAIQLENLRLCRRYSDPELGSHSIITRNIISNDDSTRIWMDDCNQLEHDKPSQILEFLGWQWNMRTMTMQTTTSRRRGVLKQLRHLMELAKRKKYVRTKDLALVIGEIQCTRAQFKRGTLHLIKIQKQKDKKVTGRGWNMWTQPNKFTTLDITWWINKLAHIQPLYFMRLTKWMTFLTEASSSGSEATLTRENKEKPVGKRLLINKTVTIYCINKDKGSITIAPPVYKVLELAEQHSQTMEASNIPGLSNAILDSLQRLSSGRKYAMKRIPQEDIQ
ncbi:MAG: hypothetical protein EZS28_003398 [Streblomastix strix]|uniref:Uncharacterized protein n=1 Tax=Streblomastix strix TaxID=222440 RepID=A0A5J4X190_9EUKA|nr:MAG: hypothetical protein EZS28_003398 [Streblomastix strix]